MGNLSFEGATALVLVLELESEESESDSDSEDSSTGFETFGTVLTIFGNDSSSEEDDSELEDELDNEAARLLRFLVRFFGAGFIDLGGGMKY